MRRIALIAACAAALLSLSAAGTASAQSGSLRAGVGRADIEPPKTGYYLGGWTRADRLALGQHTRLFSEALVLQRGDRKVALVAADIFMIPAGLQHHVAQSVADLGFDETNVVIGATHTHSGPGGFANYPTYNTAAPSINTVTNPASFVELINPLPTDRQLYSFIVTQIAKAIRRADGDLAPAAAGWAQTSITGLTRNRSLEAHLADHGIIEDPATGTPGQDPDGAGHTIDPGVDVLRVDKLVRRRSCRRSRRGRHTRRVCRTRRVRRPIGAWSQFPNHGTVTKSEFEAYDGDHHATAHREFERLVRRTGGVPAGQDVVNVYGNGNEGDMTAGLDHTGPAGADEVGKVEATAMFRAWRSAGRRLSTTPALDLRWTRACFCGRPVDGGGHVAASGAPGLPFFTGSEEGRGPLFDVTGKSLEGQRSASDDDAQGHKIALPVGDFPPAVPLVVVRVGDRLIASMPGEPTKEIGARVKQAALEESASAGIRRVIVSGLTNEYLSYITTPEEYDRQHYEGGSTIYGPYEGHFIRDRIRELARALAQGAPAPAPFRYDPTNGVPIVGPAFPEGSAEGRLTQEPLPVVGRLGHAGVAWQGGPSGSDRPIDQAFIRVERREAGRWREVDSDLGVAMLWRVDGRGHHTAYWEVPIGAPQGTYRFVVTASRYRLETQSFRVVAARILEVHRTGAPDGRVAVSLGYPRPLENVDLTARPERAAGGTVTFTVGRRRITVHRARGTAYSVQAPVGTAVTVGPGDARDAFGNTNSRSLEAR